MRSNLYSIFLHVALVALAATTLGLTKQKRELVAMLSPDVPQLEVGATVNPVAVHDLDGAPETLDWNTDRGRLLFVFTTTCPACQENQAAWRAVSEATQDRVDVVGISLDPVDATTTYRAENGLPFNVVTTADREAFVRDFEVNSVPTTVLVASDGRVQGVWTGALSDTQRATVVSTAR